MRRLIRFALIGLALTFTGVSSFAATKEGTNQVASEQTKIKGEVTGVMLKFKDESGKVHTVDVTGVMLKVRDQAGKTHLVRVANPQELEKLNIGDNVDVKLEKGKAVSIEKAD